MPPSDPSQGRRLQALVEPPTGPDGKRPNESQTGLHDDGREGPGPRGTARLPAASPRRPQLTSLTGGNFFLHSSDRARRSLCMFSSSFLTASGLLVLDMIHPVSGPIPERRKRTPALSAPGGHRRLPAGPAGPPAARLRGSAGTPLGLDCPPAPARAPPAASSPLPRLLSALPLPSPAPLGPAGSGRGAL